MDISNIKWENNTIKIIDQTKLPAKLDYIYIRNPRALVQAIRNMNIRGAPALGVAAALGIYLGIKDSKAKNFTEFSKELDNVARLLATSRPTARNLFWGLERVCSVAVRNKQKSISLIKKLIFKEAQKIIKEDRVTCRRISNFGSRLISKNDRLLTICNTGILATIDYGTALGIIYRAHQQGKNIKVYICETRPLLQGARLTTWELKRRGIDVTLICDNMAATLMAQGKIDKVITGADRIARNGDVANKIGTLNLAILSHHHKIPFYVAAPVSTLDLMSKTAKDIPIEHRDGKEVTELFFKKPVTVKDVKVFNPAFDITAHQLIAAIITDRGIVRPPYQINIKKILNK